LPGDRELVTLRDAVDYITKLPKAEYSAHRCAGTLRNAQNFVLSHLVNFASLLLQAIASDIGLGHGLPSLHTLFTCPRRLLQVTAGVFVGGCANQMHVE
jgi:hypothetical protein